MIVVSYESRLAAGEVIECPSGDGWAGSPRALEVHQRQWHQQEAWRSMPSTFMQMRVDEINEELPHEHNIDLAWSLVQEREALLTEIFRRVQG